MRDSRIARTIRGAATVGLPLVAAAMAACGGQAASGPGANAEASDADPYASASDALNDDTDASPTTPEAGAQCSVSSAPPLEVGGSSCGPQAIFLFNGPQSACSVGDSGALPCATLCPPYPGSAMTPASMCSVAGDTIQCYYGTGCSTGRRPEGLRTCRSMRNGRRRGAGAGAASPSATGRYLAETAYLEAASVDAFRRLARELEWHGAPERLRAASLRAARDEVRHAQVTRSLAEAAGGRVPRVEKKSYRVRRLEAVALENAIEGCVRETFGAATALVQAATARDPKVRDAMRRIAEDEVRHAELAWAVAGWLDLRLSSPARARVAQARRRAGAAAVRAASVDPSPTLIEELGVPSGRRARAIAIALHQALWA